MYNACFNECNSVVLKDGMLYRERVCEHLGRSIVIGTKEKVDGAGRKYRADNRYNWVYMWDDSYQRENPG